MKNKGLMKGLVALTTSVVLSATFVSDVQALSFPTTYTNHKKSLKGGTLRVGYVSDSAFKGVFASELQVDAATADVADFGWQSLFKVDKNYRYVKGGLADVYFDRKEKTATVKIGKKVNWSDGHPVEAKDFTYTYEVIANKQTDSTSYTDQVKDIEGMEEYHNGQSDHISGVEEKDNKTVVLHYKKMTPDMYFLGSGYVADIVEPYHYLKDVPFDQLASSDKVQKHPLFYGPWTMKNIVKGESIEWVPNKYYGGPKPKLDKITVELVSTNKAVSSLKAHKYDILLKESPGVYNKVKNLKDYKVLGGKALTYTYLGFKVGHADKDGNSVMDRKTPVRDRTLRQAMAYAMNTEQLDKKLFHGVKYRGNTLIPDALGKWNDHRQKGYPLNLKKANHLLDKAGYKMQKDGYRTLPNGKKFTLRFLYEGDALVARNYMEQCKKIGVKVKLKDDRLQNFNTFTEELLNDGKGWDLWMSGWDITGAPTREATSYTVSSPYNFAHFATKENTALIDSLSSEKAFDQDYQLKQFYKWQAYMNKEAYVVPRDFEYYTYPVSKKVKGYTLDPEKGYWVWSNVSLTK